MHHTRSAALFVTAIGLLAGALAHGAGPDKSSSAAHEKRAQAQPQAERPIADSSAATAQPAAESAKPAAESSAISTATTVVVASTTTAVGKAPAQQRNDAGDSLQASVLSDSVLAEQRGGTETHNQNNVAGTVTDNVASQLTTGSNSISENSFSNSSGIPIVIQNSGNNVLIQNSTILNLQLTSPAK